jgi:hypothetical protein
MRLQVADNSGARRRVRQLLAPNHYRGFHGLTNTPGDERGSNHHRTGPKLCDGSGKKSGRCGGSRSRNWTGSPNISPPNGRAGSAWYQGL